MKPRGQALVLFCIGLLLLTLMVLITLSISSKVKERIELQTVADAAAYSEAVVTARSFNAISLLNRTQVSHMVALSAVQSLISWSGYAKATLKGAEQALNDMSSSCTMTLTGPVGPNCGCSDSDLAAARSALAAHRAVIDAQWQPLDRRAGEQQRAVQRIAGRLFNAQTDIFVKWARKRIEGRGGTRSLAETIALEARRGSPWRSEDRELFVNKAVMSNSSYPSQEEMGRAVANYETAGILGLTRNTSSYSVDATMGSRLDGFVTSRAGGGAVLTSMLNRLIGPAGFTSSVADVGSGYFSSTRGVKTHGQKGKQGGGYGWGDDHGSVTLNRLQGGTCKTSGSANLWAHVYGSDEHQNDDEHLWSPPWDADSQPPDTRHTYGACVLGRHGIWPFSMDFNDASVDDRNDLFGQPKNVVVVMRDLSVRDARPDPWALQFNYQFSAGTSGTDFDLKKDQLARVDKMQAAVATGLVYYHRSNGDPAFVWEHWREPPNFFNPFWRATLIATDADERGRGGVNRGDAAMDALSMHGLTRHANLIRLLRREGFEGFQ